jgi:acyl CoA:acetate/3-ketoacid CoA transferase alpha subunit
MDKIIPLLKRSAAGDTVYAAGFTHLIPFAAGHEIIRQGSKT